MTAPLRECAAVSPRPRLRWSVRANGATAVWYEIAMSLEQQVVVRATPLTVVVIFLNACFLSVVFVGGGLALALHRHHQTLVWACAAAVAVGWTLTATRLRARFTSTGIEARNAFR